MGHSSGSSGLGALRGASGLTAKRDVALDLVDAVMVMDDEDCGGRDGLSSLLFESPIIYI